MFQNFKMLIFKQFSASQNLFQKLSYCNKWGNKFQYLLITNISTLLKISIGKMSYTCVNKAVVSIITLVRTFSRTLCIFWEQATGANIKKIRTNCSQFFNQLISYNKVDRVQ